MINSRRNCKTKLTKNAPNCNEMRLFLLLTELFQYTNYIIVP